MSTASFTPGPRSPGRGSSALGGGAAQHRHFLSKALHVIRVYAEAMFRVVVLGEFAERAPFARR